MQFASSPVRNLASLVRQRFLAPFLPCNAPTFSQVSAAARLTPLSSPTTAKDGSLGLSSQLTSKKIYGNFRRTGEQIRKK
jgi:hypothetical protein